MARLFFELSLFKKVVDVLNPILAFFFIIHRVAFIRVIHIVA
jgi:hypothetical protein